MIRFNIQGPTKRYPHPAWFKQMLADAIEAFRKEWQVTYDDVIAWAWKDPKSGSERLCEALMILGVKPQPYYREDLPSWGVILYEADPVVVEYILKYGDQKEFKD
jgi:hypothetical protein